MMKGFFSRLFAPKQAESSSEDEVVAAIAAALQMYRQQNAPRIAVTVRKTQACSAWNCKSYGMTRLPERNRRW